MNKNNTSGSKLFDPRSGNRPVWVATFFVAFITFIVYLPALQNGFVNWDDNVNVYDNQYIKSIDFRFLKWVFSAEANPTWQPLTLLSFAADYKIWKLEPSGYHLTNIVFHILNTVLVYLLVIKLNGSGKERMAKKDLFVALLTALLFAIHPVHVESVVWVSGRTNILCAFFFLLSLLAYLQYASCKGLERRVLYVASLISYALSLMSKPMSITLPVILIIIDLYPLKRLSTGRGLTRVIVEKMPFLLLSALSFLATMWAAEHSGHLKHTIPLIQRLLVAIKAFIFYLIKMILPFNLAPFYPHPVMHNIEISFFSFEYMGSLIALFLIIIACILTFKRNKGVSVIWSYYIVMLIPTIGIFQVGGQATADRYAYLSSLGPFILMGFGVTAVFERCKKKRFRFIIIGALILLSSLLGLKTMRQTAIWKDSITLWSHEIIIFPGVAHPYYNRGLGYDSSGAYQEAIRDFSKAIEINHSHASAYNNRGVAYGVIGNYQQALKDFEKVIELDPENITVYNNRGSVYYSMGNYSQAVEDYKKAVEFDPKNAKTYYNLGLTYSQMGDMGQALINYKKAAALGLKEAFNLPPPSSSSGYP